MVTPTVDDLNTMIRMDLIKNNFVTMDDVNLTTKFYSPYFGEIKGKMMRSRPTSVVRNIVKIPNESLKVQHELTVSIDRSTVNCLKFLSTISH